MKNYAAARRNSILLVLSLLMIATALLAWYLQFRDAAKAPVFSVESGFYEDAFHLEITSPEGYSVYYTLDSTDPDENSILYTGPIYIDNATYHENVYSMTEGMTVQEWGTLPEYLIDKCTVVRAVVIPDSDLGLKPSQVVTKSFFVGFDSADFDNCGVISIVTDPHNLFDSKDGIYVAGDKYAEYLATSEDPEATSWAYRPANYRERGREWEREANITFWDADGNLQLVKDIGIRIQGGWSRAYVPRSLNLFAREEYDGSPTFEYDFFGTSHMFQSLTLSAGGTGYLTRMNDYLMTERIQDLSYSKMSFRPYVMFLDGEYWGFYWLTEKYDADYLQKTYDLGSTDVVLIKAGELEVGYAEDLALYKQLVQFFEHSDMSLEENYRRACELIDMENFLDYYATLIYIGRMHDWPDSNESLWRTRTVSDQPYADGKWRWMLFDCNSFCMTQNLIDHDTIPWVLEESVFFRALWENPDFRERFEVRILEIADQYFDAEEMAQFIESYRQAMTPALEKTWKRFFGINNEMLEQFDSQMRGITNFYAQRRAVVASWFD